VAIELDESGRRSLGEAQRLLRSFDRLVRWPPAQNLHLTLKFLGEVPDADVPGVCEAARFAAERSAPFGFALEGLGCFPPKGPARIVWAGVKPDGEGLPRCQKAVEEETARVGFKPERRPFSPHLTIGRVRQVPNTRELRAAVETTEWAGPGQHVEELVVFESDLRPSGAVYRRVAGCRLGGEQA
jgi:2'-5' RNA ligase